jgi:hypothetical protein
MPPFKLRLRGTAAHPFPFNSLQSLQRHQLQS